MNTQIELHAGSDAVARRPGKASGRAGPLIAGAGAPVVLLHSSLSSKAQWTALAERLAPRFRVIALDLHGYGDNAMPDAVDSFTLDDEVRLVADAVDRLVPPHVRVHIVGHSYGGLVALRFAQRSRGRVASLSLYEPVAFNMLCGDPAALADVRQVAESVMRFNAAGEHARAAQVFVDFWSGAGTYERLPNSAQAKLERQICKVPLDFQAALSWPPKPDAVRSIAVPTLLLSGNHSPAVAKHIVRELARSLPKRYVGRVDAGHMGPMTEPHLVNPWIEAFIDMCVERDIVDAVPALDPLTAYSSAAD
jgi:pimeloyl-ACP methyl ester carboxylesterase